LLNEVSADEKVRLIQAVAHCCGTWPTGSKLEGTWDIVRTPTSSPLRTPPPPATWQLKRRCRTRRLP